MATVRNRSVAVPITQGWRRFCEQAHAIVAGVDAEPSWESVLALDPGARNPLSEEEFGRARCSPISPASSHPCVVGHSPAVVALAAGAGRRRGLVEADVTALRRAGFLHDIRRVGVSAAAVAVGAPAF